MSHNPPQRLPSHDNIEYDPLPLTTEHGDLGLQQHQLYDPPSRAGEQSAEPSSGYATPQMDASDLPSHDPSTGLPLGAERPRFLGQALYNEPGGPNPRDSYASSHNTFPSQDGRASEYDSSVYGLNQASQGPYRDDPRGSEFFAGTPEPGVPMSPVGHSRYMEEKRRTYVPTKARSKRKMFILGGLVVAILLILVVVIPLYFVVFKKKGGDSSDTSSNSGSGGSGSGKSGSSGSSLAVTGGSGSKVTMDDGSQFTYTNQFGGTWYWDVNDPFNNNAQAQSWTPPLNTTFNYGVDKIRGVNLGGWLTTEPFISPALYEKYNKANPKAVDEWTLSQAMAADTASGGLNQLEDHYKTFITEQDFAEIAGAGLNFVRIPLPYWAIEVRDNEPFLPKTAWTYFLKAIQWARKYGLRINLDLHALPGSQNGWNHSGKLGSVNVLNGPMGLANAQRSLDYIRIIAEFISQPQYKDVVALFGVTNEPQGPTIGQPNLQAYYMQAYNLVRTASGTGQGNGPMISLHDGFIKQSAWAGFLTNSDRVSLDTHPYICFGSQSDADMSTYGNTPCNTWGSMINTSMAAFGLTAAGEFSNAVTDCGLWVNGVDLGTRYEGTYNADGGNWPRVGSCDQWTNWASYDANMKKNIQNFALASMDALQNWFFWTWKIGNSSVSNTVESPSWSYQLGLQNGWMPQDPRSAAGSCGNTSPWNGPLKSWQTGGAGAGQLPASATNGLGWPPASISNGGAANALPTYTPTGAVPTLPAPTFSGSATKSASAGSGWQNAQDSAGLMVTAAGCSYLDPWVGPSAAPPSPLCAGGSRKREPVPMPEPQITAVPPMH